MTMRLTYKTLNLVDLLTEASPTIVAQGSGHKVAYREGLLEQLRGAVLAGMEGTGGSSSFGSRPPIDSSAADLLDELSDYAAQALAAVTSKPTPYGHAEDYIREFAKVATEDTVVELKIRATLPDEKVKPGTPAVFRLRRRVKAPVLLAEFVERIEDFFNPPSIREIPVPCPVCGTRYVERLKEGELVRSNALNIHRDRDSMKATEARCAACKASWSPSQFPFLAKLIGAELPADIEPLALPDHTIEIVGGIPTFYCTAPDDAECHWWPECDCDYWDETHDERHPKVQHDHCWWPEFYGTTELLAMWSHPDDVDMPTEHPRAGFDVEWEESPLWWFADVATEAKEDA